MILFIVDVVKAGRYSMILEQFIHYSVTTIEAGFMKGCVVVFVLDEWIDIRLREECFSCLKVVTATSQMQR